MAALSKHSSNPLKSTQIKGERSKKDGVMAVFLQGRCDKWDKRDICD